MAKAVMETAAQRYRRITAEKAAKEELFDLETPSGMIWKVRRPDLALFIASGIMPMSLAAKIAEQQKENGVSAEQAFADLEWKDQIRTIEFSAKVVRYIAVSPKIVETPTKPDEIAYDEVLMEDFNALFAWAMPGGGDEAKSLETFPR